METSPYLSGWLLEESADVVDLGARQRQKISNDHLTAVVHNKQQGAQTTILSVLREISSPPLSRKPYPCNLACSSGEIGTASAQDSYQQTSTFPARPDLQEGSMCHQHDLAETKLRKSPFQEHLKAIAILSTHQPTTINQEGMGQPINWPWSRLHTQARPVSALVPSWLHVGVCRIRRGQLGTVPSRQNPS